MNFSPEILNHILSFRPTHPIASLLKYDIEYWGRKRMYFNKYYFKKPRVIQMMTKLQRHNSHDDFYFKCYKIIFSRPGFNSINDILIDCIKLYGVPSAIKNNRSQIQQFAYTINNINYILCNDPNDVNVITWKRVQELCIKHEIVFRNQTFTKFCSELKEKFETPIRKEFNDDEKRQILKLHNFKCKLCDITIGGKVKFDIDHIRPLSNGGGNELDNIQPLCKPCHKDKTLNEQLEGSFNKIDDAISTYNIDVSEIMTNVKSYAFVETINEPINETDTVLQQFD